MPFVLLLICIFMTSCSTLLPMAEKAGEKVAEEVIDDVVEDSLEEVVRKEVLKAFIGLICMGTIAGYALLFFNRKLMNFNETPHGSNHQESSKGCQTAQAVESQEGFKSPPQSG